MITTQPPPSYDAAMASSPNQNTNPSTMPTHLQHPRNAPANNYANIYQPSRTSNSNQTVHASTFVEPPSKSHSWQIDPSKAGNHKFQLAPPTYKP